MVLYPQYQHEEVPMFRLSIYQEEEGALGIIFSDMKKMPGTEISYRVILKT